MKKFWIETGTALAIAVVAGFITYIVIEYSDELLYMGRREWGQWQSKIKKYWKKKKDSQLESDLRIIAPMLGIDSDYWDILR